MKKRKPTQKDIAKAVGVSQALVSLVLANASADIAKTTKTRIFEAAERLGYRTENKRAKALVYIRPVVTRGHHQEHWVYDSYDEFYNRYQNCFVEQAFNAGYSLIVQPHTELTELTRWLMEWEVDGVIWHGRDPSMAAWIAERYPMVQINRHEVVEADAVSANQAELVTLAMDYLRARGHERIVHIPTQPHDSEFRELRDNAYLNYTKKFGFPNFEEAFPFKHNFELQECVDVLCNLLSGKKEQRPTAIITPDIYAFPFIKELSERGWRTPEDISIFGNDNISVSAFASPPLTTLDTRHEEIARLAINLLLERIKNRGAAFQKVFVTPKVVERESVATLKGSKHGATAASVDSR